VKEGKGATHVFDFVGAVFDAELVGALLGLELDQLGLELLPHALPRQRRQQQVRRRRLRYLHFAHDTTRHDTTRHDTHDTHTHHRTRTRMTHDP